MNKRACNRGGKAVWWGLFRGLVWFDLIYKINNNIKESNKSKEKRERERERERVVCWFWFFVYFGIRLPETPFSPTWLQLRNQQRSGQVRNSSYFPGAFPEYRLVFIETRQIF